MNNLPCSRRRASSPASTRRRACLIAGLAMLAGPAFAQTVPAGSTSPDQASSSVTSDSGTTRDQVTMLSPFEVKSTEDTGYLATSALSGTRLRSSLADIPAAVSVVTKDFMNDINATDLNSLLIYTTGTEVSGPGGNFSGAKVQSTFLDFETQLQFTAPQNRVRGLVSADLAQDFFLTQIAMDSYNIDRVEISRGANSMLYGLGSPGGIINYVLKSADLENTSGEVHQDFGEYGSLRNSIDYNQVLLKNKLAVRVDTLHDKKYYRIHPTFDQDNRAFVAATYQPFAHTTIKANAEFGREDGNKPWDRPPFDGYSMWWQEGKPVWNSATERFSFLGTPQAPFSFDSVYSNPAKFSPNNFETTAVGLGGTTYNMELYYSDPNSANPGIPGTNFQGIEGQTRGGGMKGLAGWDRVYNHFIHQNDYTSGFWRINMMTDPKVFDFFHYQLDGPNNYEWARWQTFNAYLDQTFLDNHAGFRLAFDNQHLDDGDALAATYDSYQLKIDINQVLPNGAPNPNFGRLVLGGSGFAHKTSTDAKNLQATAFYDLDLHAVGPKWLGSFLGQHTFTGAYTRQDTSIDDAQGTPFDSGNDYTAAIWGPGDVEGVSSVPRLVSLLHYVGPSVANAAAPGDARAQAITGQWPSNLSTVAILANPSVTSGVGTPDPSPTGWVVGNYGIVHSGRYDLSNTQRAGYMSRTRQEVNSAILIAQDKWFDGTLVTTEGIRRDTVWSYDAGGAPEDPNTGVGIGDWSQWSPKLAAEETHDSKDYGAVLHSPEFINRYLPWHSNLSLFYSYSDNFTATAQRYNVYDQPLGPESGKTKEYGFRVSMFDNKFNLRVGHYKTSDALSSSLVNLGGYINQIPLIIGETFVENALPNNGLNQGNTAGLAAWNTWVQTPGAQQFLNTFRFTNTNSTKVDWNPPAGIASTSDVVSTGWEFEAVVNPTRNWRVAFNATESEAVRSNTATDLQQLLNNVFAPMLNGPAGTLIDDNYKAPIADTFKSNVELPVETITRQDGAPTPELAKWHWNLVTNYAFTEGPLKHWNISGGIRWDDKQAIGYPVLNDAVLGGVADVRHPYYSPTRTYYSASIGYTFPHVWRNLNWHVQLYLKNIGVGNRLIPVHAQPDGSIDSWEIDQPMTWTLANTIKF